MRTGIAVWLKKHNFVLAIILVELGALVAVAAALRLTFSPPQSNAAREAAIERAQRGQLPQQPYNLVLFTRTTSPAISSAPISPATAASFGPTPALSVTTTAATPAPLSDDWTAYEYQLNGVPVGVYVKVTELSEPGVQAGPAPVGAVIPEYSPDSPRSGSSPLSGWPVKGRITQGFGCSPYYTGIPGPGCQDLQPWFHDGIDIAAPAGTPVQARLEGVVTFAGPDGAGPACGDYRGFGLGLIVDNQDGWQALYAHLSGIDVAVGQAVTPETIIGAVGQTGCVTGPHLHFGLRRDNDLVNPKEFMMGLE